MQLVSLPTSKPWIESGNIMSSANNTPSDASLADRLFAFILYLLPHHLLSQLMHWLTRCEWVPLKNLLIRGIIKLYKVDMALAEQPDPEQYPTFNAFFTRALKPDVRPISNEASTIASPVDGAVSQAGDIADGRIFQAKGQDYSLEELLGGDAEWTERFSDGKFATIYLSPRDYHRIHMPLAGELKRMIHIPGRLFSVSPSTTRAVPRLFSRNERVVNLFETDHGPMAVIMVGAIFVASMDTVWAGTVAPISQRINQWDYQQRSSLPVNLTKGDEMGRFNMGSTVILLFGKDAIEWSEGFLADAKVVMGEQIATISPEQMPEAPDINEQD
ncbi:MAG: archaetidylserine decarboxylase [Chromatiales bacterium]|nr:archaetidylserine decarboxylase [Chromatiales bacterium]